MDDPKTLAWGSLSGQDVPRINQVFYFLYSAALTSRALLTLEGLPLPGLANF